jgi:NTE family protein
MGGGGARGALQVGALRALFEVGMAFDLMVGTSAGAVNATYLAVHGYDLATLEELEVAWHEASEARLLSTNYLDLSRCLLLGRLGDMDERMETFYRQHGLDGDLRFGDLGGARLIQVASDLTARAPRLYGTRADDSVLEGLLASTAVPPWVWPLEQGRHMVMDGGLVSNLPIEAALAQGATTILALDLADWRSLEEPEGRRRRLFMGQMMATIEQRQIDLEMRVAELCGVPVWRVPLRAEPTVAPWDFSAITGMFRQGYEEMRRFMDDHPDCLSVFAAPSGMMVG